MTRSRENCGPWLIEMKFHLRKLLQSPPLPKDHILSLPSSILGWLAGCCFQCEHLKVLTEFHLKNEPQVELKVLCSSGVKYAKLAQKCLPKKHRQRDSRAEHLAHSVRKRDNHRVCTLCLKSGYLWVGKIFQEELFRKPCLSISYRL